MIPQNFRKLRPILIFVFFLLGLGLWEGTLFGHASCSENGPSQ